VTAARVAVAVVAVLVLGWLAVMERDLRLQDAGTAALRPGSPPAALVAAADDLRAARLLNPDPAPDVNLALVQRAQGEPRRALATIEDVVAREPDNLQAWAILAVLARGQDDGAVERALAARRRLDPLNAR
jgi:hypothetical protein